MEIVTFTILKILKKFMPFGIIGRLGSIGLFFKIGKKICSCMGQPWKTLNCVQEYGDGAGK